MEQCNIKIKQFLSVTPTQRQIGARPRGDNINIGTWKIRVMVSPGDMPTPHTHPEDLEAISHWVQTFQPDAAEVVNVQ